MLRVDSDLVFNNMDSVVERIERKLLGRHAVHHLDLSVAAAEH